MTHATHPHKSTIVVQLRQPRGFQNKFYTYMIAIVMQVSRGFSWHIETVFFSFSGFIVIDSSF